MLDPAQPSTINLTDFNAYLDSCRQIAVNRLAEFASLDDIAGHEEEINCYARLRELAQPRQIKVLDGLASLRDVTEQAWRVLKGDVLWEHTCAGEATRLNLGAKYFIVPPLHLSADNLGRDADLGKPLNVLPNQLNYLSLGQRHMLQQAWNIWLLAKGLGQNPRQALFCQHLLIIVNRHTARQVVEDFIQARFYGFDRPKVLFMVQQAFPGIGKDQLGNWQVAPSSPPRLHNHGQMVMQTIMDNQLFYLDDKKQPRYLSWSEYERLLESKSDKVSFNIEDLDYLNDPIDMKGLAASYNLGRHGFNMVMEVVPNDLEAPIKGGGCYYDQALGRDVIIESFQLKGILPEQITHLNKNVNHYPNPARAMQTLRRQGLSMPIVVKDNYLYFQPVQGDINFIVPTAFVERKRKRPICSWKSGRNTPDALRQMHNQQLRPGFMEWVNKLTGLG